MTKSVPSQQPSQVHSPVDQAMEFIEVLGDQLEEAFAAAVSPGTEKGNDDNYHAGPSTTEKGGDIHMSESAIPDPPDYWDEKSDFGGSNAASATGEKREKREDAAGKSGDKDGNDPNTCPHGRRCRCENRRNKDGLGGGNPWFGSGDWRERAASHPFFAAWANAAGDASAAGADPRGFGGFPGGRGGRGGMGMRGGPMFFGGPWGWKDHRHGGHHGGGGRHWGRGRGGFHCPPFPGQDGNNDNDEDGNQFTPAVDLFDTPNAYVVHISLAGALKEDIGINYNVDSSELEVSGVVHRPGDEEFLKTIVDGRGERKVGVFERKVKLEGKDGKTSGVDADGITAKLENGLLEVTVPKVRKADEPEKRKINID